MAAPGTGAEGEGSRKASGLNGAKILLVEDEFLIALISESSSTAWVATCWDRVGSVAEALVLLRHDDLTQPSSISTFVTASSPR